MKTIVLVIILLFSITTLFAKEVDTISMENVADMASLHAKKMLPRGSALITSSGLLKNSGVTAIIHAGAASWHLKEEPYNPTLESLKNSIMNAMILADRFKHKRVAIPFLGGGIFFKGLDIELQDLSDLIVETAFENANGIELVFISIDAKQVKAFQNSVQKINSPLLTAVKGSIVDSKAHKASAIVNAGNMEMIFGTGLSGVIAKATGQKAAINLEAKKMILELLPPVLATKPKNKKK